MEWMESLVFAIIAWPVVLLITGWMAGAIFLDVGNSTVAGKVVATAWVLAVMALFVFWQPLWKPLLLLVSVWVLFCGWWFSLKPSQDRPWDPNFSKPASVSLDGDLLTFSNVRNSVYRTSPEDCLTRYETRQYHLSRLRQVDVMILYWGSPWMSHPMFVFDFGTDGRLCISIEVRYRVGQKYGFLRSLYRQQELMYVVSDERDAVMRRVKFGNGLDLYLYRLQSDPVKRHQFLFEYIERINQLATQPRWYNGLTTNCTTAVYTQSRGRIRWDWRLLFNGSLDRMLYDNGGLDRSQPFEVLKNGSRVNDVANRAPVEGFGDFIRRELPGYGFEKAT